MVTKEPHHPIDRTKISKGIDVKLEKTLVRPDAFYADADIEFLLAWCAAAAATATATPPP